MKKYLKKKHYLLIAIVVMLCLVGGFVGSYIYKSSAKGKILTAKERLQAKRNETLSSVLKMNESADANEEVRAIVTLKEKSVADTENVSRYNSNLKSKEKKIIKKQENIVEEVEKITGNKVVNQSAYLVNSISIDATRKQMRKIAKLDGVDKVYEATIYKTTMTNAVKEGNVKSQWESKDYGYKGEGVVIAVIDTGVNYKHQDMVLDEGVKTKFTKEQWKEKIELLGYGSYFTDKVPFGYDYTCGKNDCLNTSEFHGYHVSSISAGNGDIEGVAKNAQVLGIKVFGDDGYGATTDDLVRGIEDSVKLGADIINMSLGSSCGLVSDEDYLEVAVNNATKEGVISCIAASNDGTSAGNGDATNLLNIKDTASVGSPAVADTSLAVASAENVNYRTKATTTVKLSGNDMTFEYVDLFGYGFNFNKVKLVNTGYAVDKNKKLTVKENKLKGNIAVVKYGVSTLNDKVYRLSKAGVKGIILVDNNDTINTKIVCHDWYGVPVIVVNNAQGRALLEAASKRLKYTTIDTKESGEVSNDVEMSSFSSWGPTNELGIKPEITAPGGNIKAALDGNDNYAVYSGTSMATPFIAGSEAVMLNAIKSRGLNISGEELVSFMKNSLMNTADVIIDKESGAPYSIRYQGSGMVDVYGAVDNNVIATYNDKAKVELGEITSDKTIEITLTNYGDTDAKYTLKNSPIYTDYTENKKSNNEIIGKYGIKAVEGASLVYNTNSVTVPAKGNATVIVNVHLGNSFKDNQFVEAFIELQGQGVQNIGLPVLGFYGDYDKESIIDKSVYEKGTSLLKNSVLEQDAMTSLAGYNEYAGIENIMGMEYSKVTELGKDIDVKNNAIDKKEQCKRITKNAIAAGLLDGKMPNKDDAIDVSFGESLEFPVINGDDGALFRVKADEKTGCLVNIDESKYPIITLYDKNMNMLDTNLFGYMFGFYEPMEFSLQENDEIYIEIGVLTGEVGLHKVIFEKKEYDEKKDYYKLIEESKEEQVEQEKLKENKTVKIKYEGVFSETSFTPKKEGYYTFDFTNIKTAMNIDISEYIVDKKGTITEVNNVLYDTIYGKYSRELKMKKGAIYLVTFAISNEEFSEEIIADVKVTKTDGKNVYTLEQSFNGDKNAFSPNGDLMRDKVVPLVTQLRNAKELTVKVLDASKKEIRNIATHSDMRKSMFYDISSNSAQLLYNYINGEAVGWDGTVYNKSTGEYETVNDGQYYIQIEAKRTKTSESQVITMPVKVDTVEPEISKFDVQEVNGDTVVEFKAKDNNGMSPYFYVDYINGDTGETCTLAKTYAEADRNEAGNYIVNLGKTDNSESSIMIEDEAGNSVVETFSVGESEEDDENSDEDVDYDMEDNDSEVFELCDGVTIIGRLENGMEKGLFDGDLLIEGQCLKNMNIFINGIEADYGFEDSLGNKEFWCYIPLDKTLTETDINIIVKKEKEEVFNKTYNIRLDRHAPEMKVLEESGINKVKYYPIEQSILVLLSNSSSNEIEFKLQVTDDNLLEDTFNVYIMDEEEYDEDTVDNDELSYENIGKGLYSVKCKGIEDSSTIYVNISDEAGNITEQAIVLCKDDKIYEDYSSQYDLDIQTNVEGIEILDKTSINEDGTFTVTGEVGSIPNKLVINGENVYVNPKTRTFEHNIKVNKGYTNVLLEAVIAGQEYKYSTRLYYDEMIVDFLELPKVDDNGIIKTNNEIFNLKGVIKSYMSIATIEINGDNMYTASDVLCSLNNKQFIKEFNYNIKLVKGMNVIGFAVENPIGQKVEKIIKVELL